MSQLSGIRAAVSFGYPICYSLNSYGEKAVLTKCQNKTVQFTPVMTKCGVQPFFQNFTIGKDGYLFSPCYWNGGIVLFNTRLYEHRNNEWQELQSTQFAQAVQLRLLMFY